MADSRNLVLQLLITAKDQASGVFGRVFAALNDTTNVIAGKIRAAFTNLFGGALAGAIEFEAQLDRVQAKGDYTAESMETLKQAALDIGAQFGATGTEAAQGMEALAAAGLNAAEVMQALPPVLALARAEGISLDQAAEKLSDSLAIVGLGFDQAARMADVLAKGAKLSTTEATALATALSTAGGIARTAGLDLEQTVAALTALAAAGIKGEKAGTALQAILTQLLNPASQASKELSALGITIRDLGGVIDGLASKGAAGNAAILAFGETAGPGLRALIAQGSGALGELETGLRNATGAAQQTANEMAGNLKGALEALNSAWENVKATLLEPVLQPLAQAARDAAGALNDNLNSGALKPIQDAIREFVVTGIQAVKDFLAAWKFDDAKTALNDFATGAKDAFIAIRDVGATAADVVSVAWNTLAAGFRAIAAALLETAASAVQTLGNVEALASKIGLGTLERANELRNTAAGLEQKAAEILAGVNTNAANLKQAFNDLTGAAQEAEGAQNRLKDALPVKEIEQLAKSLDDYRNIAERANAAADQAREDFLNGKISAADYAKAVLSAAQANDDLKGASERGAQATQTNTAATRAAVDQSTRLATELKAQQEAQEQNVKAARDYVSSLEDVASAQLAGIRAEIDLATAKGNTWTVQQKSVELAQLEARWQQTLADAKRLVTAAEIKKTEADIAGLTAIQQRTEAQNLELAGLQLRLQALGQQSAAEQLMIQLTQQRLQLQQQQGGGLQQNTQQIEQNTGVVQQNTQTLQQNTQQQQQNTDEVKKGASAIGGMNVAMKELSDAAYEAFQGALVDIYGTFDRLPPRIVNVSDEIQELTQKLNENREVMRYNQTVISSMTDGFDRAVEASDRIRVSFYEQALQAQELAEQLQAATAEGARGLDGLARQAQASVASFDLLDEQRLNNLQKAIDDANNKLRQMQQETEDARQRLVELDAQLAEAQGQQQQADLLRQQLDYQQQLADLEQARIEAQAAGNQELLRLLDEQLAKLNELNAVKIQNIENDARQTQGNQQTADTLTKIADEAERAHKAMSAMSGVNLGGLIQQSGQIHQNFNALNQML